MVASPPAIPDIPPDIAQVASRGAIAITAAKAYFMVTGLLTHIVLPRILSAEQFGLYSIAVGVASIINAVVITGTVQTVSKFVSADRSQAGAITRKALTLQVLVGGGIAAAYYLLAPIIARYLHDAKLTDLFRLTALITFSYSLYAIFVGALNGRREFFKQASLDVWYSTFKVVFVLALAALGYAVMGALGGWLLASVLALGLSALVAGAKQATGPPRPVGARELLSYQSMVLILILIVNLLQRVDLLMVKALSSQDQHVASTMAGYYNAVTTIASVTFQSIIALPIVAFPLIAESAARADAAVTSKYIYQTMRFSLMIMAFLAAVFSSNAGELLGLIYTQEYLAGTAALRLVPWGMLLFGLLYVSVTIISSCGTPRASVFIGLITLLVAASLNFWLIPRLGLQGAALGTVGAMFVGFTAAALYLLKHFSALLRPLSGIRILLAVSAVYFLSALLPQGGLFTLAKLVLQGLSYLVVLLTTGEIGKEELKTIRRMLTAGAGSADASRAS